MGKKIVDLTGQKFGMWMAIEYVVGSRWRCECECGVIRDVKTHSLKSGGSLSCGCVSLGRLGRASIKHGMSSSKIYTLHCNIKKRCYNDSHKSYKNYGGRDITVCNEWLNKEDGLQNFSTWCKSNGYKEGLQIDRIDNDGNYEPSNCRFVTNRENSLNTRKQANNTSGYVGIYRNNIVNLWTSRITVLGVEVSLGCHPSIKSALEARNNYIVENNLTGYKIQKYVD